MPFHIWAKTSHVHPPKGLVSDKVVMTLMEPFMRKGRKVTTDNCFTLFLLAKKLKKKKASLVGTMNKVRLELPASAKCLQQRYFSKLMKTGDMTILTVYQCKSKKNVCVFSSLHLSVELGESKKRNWKKWNFITRANVVLTWLIKWPRSIQSKQAPVVAPLLFSTTFWIWQASMHLCSIKKQTGDKISRRDFLFKFATELREDYCTLLKIKQKHYYC